MFANSSLNNNDNAHNIMEPEYYDDYEPQFDESDYTYTYDYTYNYTYDYTYKYTYTY